MSMQSEAINELSAALAKAQGQMKAATYNRVNPHFKNRYADLAAVLDAIRGPLCLNGLSYTQTIHCHDNGNFLITDLHHASGQWKRSMYPLPPSGAKPQEFGSALTYARRYSLSAIVGIASEDDDDANSTAAPRAEAQPVSTITEAVAKKLEKRIAAVKNPEELLGLIRQHYGIQEISELPATRAHQLNQSIASYEAREKGNANE